MFCRNLASCITNLVIEATILKKTLSSPPMACYSFTTSTTAAPRNPPRVEKAKGWLTLQARLSIRVLSPSRKKRALPRAKKRWRASTKMGYPPMMKSWRVYSRFGDPSNDGILARCVSSFVYTPTINSWIPRAIRGRFLHTVERKRRNGSGHWIPWQNTWSVTSRGEFFFKTAMERAITFFFFCKNENALLFVS